MSRLTLFELANEFKSLEALADQEDLSEEFIRDTVEGLTGQIEDKAVAVAQVVLHLDSVAESIKSAAKAMALRAERVQRRADSLRHYLLLQLQIVDLKKIDTPELVIRRQTNPPSIQVTDESVLPPFYWRQPPIPPLVPDNTLIKEALEAGINVP